MNLSINNSHRNSHEDFFLNHIATVEHDEGSSFNPDDFKELIDGDFKHFNAFMDSIFDDRGMTFKN